MIPFGSSLTGIIRLMIINPKGVSLEKDDRKLMNEGSWVENPYTASTDISGGEISIKRLGTFKNRKISVVSLSNVKYSIYKNLLQLDMKCFTHLLMILN